MPAVQFSSLNLANYYLQTPLKDTKSNKLSRIQLVDGTIKNAKIYPGCAAITLRESEGMYTLDLYSTSKKKVGTGMAEFNGNLTIGPEVNLLPDSFAGAGKALSEAFRLIAIQKRAGNINLYAPPESVLFHIKCGYKHTDPKLQKIAEQELKQGLRTSSTSGVMQIDL